MHFFLCKACGLRARSLGDLRNSRCGRRTAHSVVGVCDARGRGSLHEVAMAFVDVECHDIRVATVILSSNLGMEVKTDDLYPVPTLWGAAVQIDACVMPEAEQKL